MYTDHIILASVTEAENLSCLKTIYFPVLTLYMYKPESSGICIISTTPLHSERYYNFKHPGFLMIMLNLRTSYLYFITCDEKVINC